MKSLTVCIYLTLCISFVLAQQNFETSKQLGFPCEILVQFYQLWKDSGFGRHPSRIERSVWIILDSNGQYKFRRWPSSRAWNKEVWRGPVPYNTTAQAHTHTITTDPRPSMKDRIFARKAMLTVYTISNKGIWKVTPDEKLTKEADANWLRGLDRNQCSQFQ